MTAEEEAEGAAAAAAAVVVEVIDEVEAFRRFLIRRFGSAQEAFEMLDADGSELLSFGELRVSLERLGISVKEAIGEQGNLMKLFRRLDVEELGELSFYQMFEAEPDAVK